MNLNDYFSDVPSDLPLTFTYDDGNGHTGAVAYPDNFSLEYLESGTYSVTITAHDGDGGTRSMSFTVTVAQDRPSQDPGGRPMEYEPLSIRGLEVQWPPVGSSPTGGPFPFEPASIDDFAYRAEESTVLHVSGRTGPSSSSVSFTGSSEPTGHVEETGEGVSGESTPPGPQGNGLTALPGYYEHVTKGQALVFNLDDVHCTDLCTPMVVAEAHISAGGLTGLSAYIEGIKAGKSLVFNLNEIDCWALCEGGRG
jgi:hypothetical protein